MKIQSLNQFATVTTLVVVLFGCGMVEVDAKEKSHNSIENRLNTHSIDHKSKKVTYHAVGKASWYGSESGNRTANGEHFNPNGISAAHRTLPFNTKVRVTHLGTNKSIIVRINDRGPYVGGRILDLSKGAAKQLGISGVTKVKIDTI